MNSAGHERPEGRNYTQGLLRECENHTSKIRKTLKFLWLREIENVRC